MTNHLQACPHVDRSSTLHQGSELIAAFHDIRRRLGHGREAWAISHERLDHLIDRGLPPAAIDRLRRLVLIVNSFDNAPVRAIKGDLSRLTKRDRRARRWPARPALYDLYPGLSDTGRGHRKSQALR